MDRTVEDFDKIWECFSNWYKDNERRFFCGHMTDKEIAYSAFLAGIKYNDRQPIEQEDNNA